MKTGKFMSEKERLLFGFSEPRMDLSPITSNNKFCDYTRECDKECLQMKSDDCRVKRFYDKYGVNYKNEI